MAALLVLPLLSAAGGPTRAARPVSQPKPVVTMQANGDLVEATDGGPARVLASPDHYQKSGETIVALPPGPDPTTLIIYEPRTGKPGTYRQQFVLHGNGISAATGVMDVKPVARGQLLIELHINPSTSCYVLLDMTTGAHRDALGIDAAVSPDGARFAWLSGPPHHYPRDEYVEVFVDGVQMRHFAGKTYAELHWPDPKRVDVRFSRAQGRAKDRGGTVTFCLPG